MYQLKDHIFIMELNAFIIDSQFLKMMMIKLMIVN